MQFPGRTEKTLIFTISVFWYWGFLCRILSDSGQNVFPDHSHKRIQFCLSSVAAERNPEGAVNDLGIHIHGGQNMAAVALGAGATGTDANSRILQNVDAVLGGDAGDAGDAEDACHFSFEKEK